MVGTRHAANPMQLFQLRLRRGDLPPGGRHPTWRLLPLSELQLFKAKRGGRFMTPRQQQVMTAITPFLDRDQRFCSKDIASKLGMHKSSLWSFLRTFVLVGYIQRIGVGQYRWKNRPIFSSIPALPPTFKPFRVDCPHCGENVALPPKFGDGRRVDLRQTAGRWAPK